MNSSNGKKYLFAIALVSLFLAACADTEPHSNELSSTGAEFADYQGNCLPNVIESHNEVIVSGKGVAKIQIEDYLKDIDKDSKRDEKKSNLKDDKNKIDAAYKSYEKELETKEFKKLKDSCLAYKAIVGTSSCSALNTETKQPEQIGYSGNVKDLCDLVE